MYISYYIKDSIYVYVCYVYLSMCIIYRDISIRECRFLPPDSAVFAHRVSLL